MFYSQPLSGVAERQKGKVTLQDGTLGRDREAICGPFLAIVFVHAFCPPRATLSFYLPF